MFQPCSTKGHKFTNFKPNLSSLLFSILQSVSSDALLILCESIDCWIVDFGPEIGEYLIGFRFFLAERLIVVTVTVKKGLVH